MTSCADPAQTPLTIRTEDETQVAQNTRQSSIRRAEGSPVTVWHDYSPIPINGPIYTKLEMTLMLIAIFTNFAFLIQLYGALPAKASWYSNLYLFDLILLFSAYLGPTTSLPSIILPNAIIKCIVAICLFALASITYAIGSVDIDIKYRDPIIYPTKLYFDEKPNVRFVCYLFVLLFTVESVFCFKRYSELKRELNRRRELRGTRFTRPSHFLLHSLSDLQESQQHISNSNQKPPPTYQQCTSPNALPSYDEVAKLLRPQRPFSRYLHIL